MPIDNDDWLVRFLRPCKFYPKSAHELVSNLRPITISRLGQDSIIRLYRFHRAHYHSLRRNLETMTEYKLHNNERMFVAFTELNKQKKNFFSDLQIKRYYSFKIKHHDMYYALMPSKEENIFKANVLTVFPNRDQLGRRILLLELGSK